MSFRVPDGDSENSEVTDTISLTKFDTNDIDLDEMVAAANDPHRVRCLTELGPDHVVPLRQSLTPAILQLFNQFVDAMFEQLAKPYRTVNNHRIYIKASQATVRNIARAFAQSDLLDIELARQTQAFYIEPENLLTITVPTGLKKKPIYRGEHMGTYLIYHKTSWESVAKILAEDCIRPATWTKNEAGIPTQYPCYGFFGMSSEIADIDNLPGYAVKICTSQLYKIGKGKKTTLKLTAAATRLATAALPPNILLALRLGRMVALQKPNGRVRGLVMGDVFRRLVARTLAQQFSPQFQTATAPHQYALATRAGGEALARSVRVATELQPNLTVLSVDGVGAYDHIARQAILQGIHGDPGLRPLLPFVRQFYASPSEYLWYDAAGTCHPIHQHEGGEQGDPLMPGLYAVAVAPALQETHRALLPGEALLAYLDDTYILCALSARGSSTNIWNRHSGATPTSRYTKAKPACGTLVVPPPLPGHPHPLTRRRSGLAVPTPRLQNKASQC